MSTVAVARRPSIDKDRALTLLQNYGVYAAIALLVIVNIAVTKDFLTVSNLRVQLFQAVPVLIVALGMALVIGTEGIDLSVGAVIALAAAFIPLYVGYGPWAAIGVALLGGAVSGAIGGSLVAVAGVQPIVATLALMIGLRGFAVILNGASAKQVNNSVIDGLGSSDWLGVPRMAWIAAALVVVIAFLVGRTTFGRQLVAIGDNRAASRLAGLPVRRVLLTVYILSGVFAAIAGLLIVGHGAVRRPGQLRAELRAERDHRGGRRRHAAQRRQGAGPRHRRRRDPHAADRRDADPAQRPPVVRADGRGRDHHRRGLHRAGTGNTMSNACGATSVAVSRAERSEASDE